MASVNRTAVAWLTRRLADARVTEADEFGALVEAQFADDAAMRQLARIVRGADRPERWDVMPESVGVRSIVEGTEVLFETDEEIRRVTHPMFDSLLASLRQRIESGQPLESDPLLDASSGLPNRLLLLDRLMQAIAYAHRHDTLIAMCAIRFDFTRVEEHMQRVVLEIADRLRHTIRELDTIARLGVEEFAIAITDLRHREDADVAVAKVTEILCEPFVIGAESYELVPRIGISFYPAHGHDPQMLLDTAREAVPQEPSIAVFGETATVV